MAVMKTIYLADDDAHIRMLIARYLEQEGYKVEPFADGQSLWERWQDQPADLLVLDIAMPGLDGLDLCKRLRTISAVPIIFVSARGEELDRILGIELGGDDYLVKPFSPRELVVRVKAIFRRLEQTQTTSSGEALLAGNLTLYPDARKVLVGQKEASLTQKEFDMLQYLLEHRGKALNRDQLLQAIWGYDYFGETRAVDDLIKRLRKKLGDDMLGVNIETVWGYGYKLDV